jgi:NAD(P)-dependent dehydrogenase (short-subunit alcohol dehydrogenase family)
MLSFETDASGDTMLLTGQVAIVTGAGRGIGRAIARALATEGAAVMVTARTDSEVRQVAGEIQKAGGRATALAADVAHEAECEKIVHAARAAFGAIHILVNNAGIYGPVQPVEKITPRQWDDVLAVNLRSAFLLSRLVLPEMYARDSGNILNISSTAAKAAYQWNSPYAASKAALLGLTRTLAAEAARHGVRVNAICPGPVAETKMSEELRRGLASQSGSDEATIRQQMSLGILQGRSQTAEEIAAAALFLVSSRASAITGQTLNVDGGSVFY